MARQASVAIVDDRKAEARAFPMLAHRLERLARAGEDPIDGCSSLDELRVKLLEPFRVSRGHGTARREKDEHGGAPLERRVEPVLLPVDITKRRIADEVARPKRAVSGFCEKPLGVVDLELVTRKGEGAKRDGRDEGEIRDGDGPKPLPAISRGENPIDGREPRHASSHESSSISSAMSVSSEKAMS